MSFDYYRSSANRDLSSREKLLKMDSKRREYDIVVIGEESHLAYNRVGLTSFFQHRKVENLYLNPQDWVSLDISIDFRDQQRLTSCCLPLVFKYASGCPQLSSQYKGHRDPHY